MSTTEWTRRPGAALFTPEPQPDPPEPASLQPVEACPTCGARFVAHGTEIETNLGYFSPPGHCHDGNCRVREYRCTAGHVTRIAIVRRCSAPGCTWHGKTACFCCPRFVTEWPALAGEGEP